MKKKGISLIVLVITIVVIIILAAAVILSLGKNNPINDAKKAKIAQTVDNFKSDLSIQVADKLLKNPMITVDEIDSNETLEGFKITDLIPSIKGTEYEDDFKVVDGKLMLKDESETDLPEETQNIIKEYIGENTESDDKNVITADMIKTTKNEDGTLKYLGATVEYTDYPQYANETTKTVWRIYNVADSGAIQLIANNYVDLTYKGTTPATGITVNGYSIKSTVDRTTLIEYLKDQSKWSEYAVSGKTTVVGAPTVEEFCSSYKLKYPDKYVVSKYVNAGDTYNGSDIAAADGYMVKLSTEADTAYSYSKSIGTSDDLYIKTETSYGSNTINGAWFVSASSENANTVMAPRYHGGVTRGLYGYGSHGVRPLVTLTSAVLVEKDDGTLVVE